MLGTKGSWYGGLGDIGYAHVERNLILRQEKGNRNQGLCRSYLCAFYELGRLYQPLRNPSNWKEVFTLQYLHANLLFYADFLLDYEENYKKKRQPLFDPRRSKFRQGHLKEITRYSSRVQEMGRRGDRLVQAVETLVEGIRQKLESDGASTLSSSRQPPSFPSFELEIRGYCQEVKGCVSRLSTSLEHDLKFLSLGRDMEQTDSLQRLTVLATIFLPLSLAAAVLSMQTRFSDLGALLYDFFGVAVVLGAFVLPFILFLSFLKFTTGHMMVEIEMRLADEHDSTSPDYVFLRNFLRIALWIGIPLLGLLIVVSFVIGMFQDVGLGGKTLGYGLAGFFLVAVLSPLPLWMMIRLCRAWKEN
ncbi:hypothetical protein ColLi_11215 [Colletotrichum liriopes]|uniref:Uncharacterized protein n=1 Tax=Colletotrichum liriopes TaxID=708192 RepID=A0AA37LXK2_9PEZI|nr:hypothetical protein ColLi_11215 [Colletotrichum liriopes]